MCRSDITWGGHGVGVGCGVGIDLVEGGEEGGEVDAVGGARRAGGVGRWGRGNVMFSWEGLLSLLDWRFKGGGAG